MNNDKSNYEKIDVHDDDDDYDDYDDDDEASITRLCHHIISKIVERHKETCDDNSRRNNYHTLHRDYSLISDEDENEDDNDDYKDDRNNRDKFTEV